MSDVGDPKVGDLVSRLDTGAIGTVAFLAVAGAPRTDPFMQTGDVEVQMSAGSSIVTAGKGFWTKWKRVDVEALAREVVLEASRA